MKRFVSVCLALAVLTTAALAQEKEKRAGRGLRAYPPNLDGAKVEVYKTIDDTKLNLYIYQPTGDAPAGGRPAIVFFFGGGWTNGSPGQFEHQCQYLQSRGMVAI